MSLEVQNLSVRRVGLPIFTDVSFTCKHGKALLLRGPNGVGKTTLLRTLAGFIKASNGDARLNGASLKDRDAFQEQLVYAAHSDAIKAQMTVKENLEFWASVYRSNTCDAALSTFNLGSLRDQLSANCSAGQKRRLGLARLLVSGRNLWLLDEPTVSLDAASKEALGHAISEHLTNGGMAIIATHDTDLIPADTLELSPPPPVSDDVWEEDFTS